MHVITISGGEAMNLKESREGCMGGRKERKEKREMEFYYNLKNKKKYIQLNWKT